MHVCVRAFLESTSGSRPRWRRRGRRRVRWRRERRLCVRWRRRWRRRVHRRRRRLDCGTLRRRWRRAWGRRRIRRVRRGRRGCIPRSALTNLARGTRGTSLERLHHGPVVHGLIERWQSTREAVFDIEFEWARWLRSTLARVRQALKGAAAPYHEGRVLPHLLHVQASNSF